MLTTLMIKAPNRAALNPLTVNSSPKKSERLDVTTSINALMTKINSPREIIMIGNAKNVIKGLMKLFTKPNTIATSNKPHQSPV